MNCCCDLALENQPDSKRQWGYFRLNSAVGSVRGRCRTGVIALELLTVHNPRLPARLSRRTERWQLAALVRRELAVRAGPTQIVETPTENRVPVLQIHGSHPHRNATCGWRNVDEKRSHLNGGSANERPINICRVDAKRTASSWPCHPLSSGHPPHHPPDRGP